MEKKYEFYPMITGTVRELIAISDIAEFATFLQILKDYPNLHDIKDEEVTPVLYMLIKELARQYSRWDKGGKNEKL
jgi:hypothetical protein